MEHHSTAKGRVARTRKSRTEKVNEGSQLIADEIATNKERYNTGWFKPTEAQSAINESLATNHLSLIQGSSGVGKSTCVIAYALKKLGAGEFRQIVFLKSPTESSDDAIGFLPNSANEKIGVHLEATRSIFREFMSKAKLELEEKRGKIILTIPNFVQGITWTDTFLIVDEAQQISPPILKLILERCGEGTVCAVMGDKAQCYAYKKRANGFTDLVEKITTVVEDKRVSKEELIGYVELKPKDNMRSDLSRRIVEIYEGEV